MVERAAGWRPSGRPDLDPTPAQRRAQERERADAYIAALETERQMYLESGRPEFAAGVDVELARARKARRRW